MTVRDTVMEGMKMAGLTGYERQADPVIRALEQREGEIVNNLIAYAVDQGLDRDRAMVALADCGLDVGGTGAGTSEDDPRIAQMEAQVEEMQATLRLLRGEG